MADRLPTDTTSAPADGFSPALNDLCRKYAIRGELVDASRDLDDLIERVVRDHELRAGSGTDRDLRALVEFVREAATFDTGSARATSEPVERLEAVLLRVSSLGHKINNPLTSLMGRAQLLRFKNQDPDTCKMAQVIEQSTGRIAGYVRELGDLVRDARSEGFGEEAPQDSGNSSDTR